MFKGYKIKLLPDEYQQQQIIKYCHAARFAYNWALSQEIDNYNKGGKFLTGFDLNKLFTQFKQQEENKWLYEISNRACKIAILNVAKAYENFFRKRTRFPNFKKKKRSKMICGTSETIRFTSNKVKLEKLGWVKLAQKNRVPFTEDVKYSNPKISYDGLNFWISVGVEIIDNQNNQTSKTEVIGIDLGLKTLAVCSNGLKLVKPNIKRDKKKLKRLQRRASKQYNNFKNTENNYIEKSRNFLKLEKEIKRVYQKITNKLDNNIHNFTSSLIKLNPTAIVIEDLNVLSMRKNRHISEQINEAKFYEIRKQLQYKCQWNNIDLIIASRWYPSSKTCSECGYKKDKLSLNERVFNCECCGFKIDRDLNAAINLKNLAI